MAFPFTKESAASLLSNTKFTASFGCSLEFDENTGWNTKIKVTMRGSEKDGRSENTVLSSA